MNIGDNMDISYYMKNRVDEQINWYDAKSIQAQTLYKRLQLCEIICASLIPIISILIRYYTWLTVITAILGSAIAVIESVTRLNKYHENWLEYRSTCELLRYHKNLYETRTYPYNDCNETVENIFVKNVENIISAENNQWKTINSTKQDGDKGKC